MKTDYLKLYNSLDNEQSMIMKSTSDWVKEYVSPFIENSFNDENPLDLKMKLADLVAFGPIFPKKYGGLDIDYISFGLMMKELEKRDSSIRVMSSIQSFISTKVGGAYPV